MSILHIKLRGQTVTILKRRARLAGDPPEDYIERVLWYALLEYDAKEGAAGAMPAVGEEELYLSAALSEPLRARIAIWSERQRCNVASAAGSLVDWYLLKFERDPGDFRMLARLGELMDESGGLAEADLLKVLRLAEGSPVSRMPAGYQARWFYQRLRPLLRRLLCDDGAMELTVERMEALLARLKTSGP